MLSFPAQTLQVGAVQVNGVLDPDDQLWIEGDLRPSKAIQVTGRLSSAGEGRFYFSGRFAGETLGECPRCLEEVRSPVSAEAHFLYADDELAGDDDPDVFPLTRGRAGEVVDLRVAVREQWLLEVPAFVLCRPDCKGLCPTCGANLNQGACSCAQKTNE